VHFGIWLIDNLTFEQPQEMLRLISKEIGVAQLTDRALPRVVFEC